MAQGSQKLKELFNCIKRLHWKIKFTMDYSTTETNFVGVTVTKVCNKFETDLYCKLTDTHQHLLAQSCHRNVYKWSIAYEQAVRFKRIYSTEEKLNNHLEQLKQWLVKRGCREDHVDSETEKTKLVKRTVSFQIPDKKFDDSIRLVLTYHPVLNQLYEIYKFIKMLAPIFVVILTVMHVKYLKAGISLKVTIRLPRKNTAFI